MSEIPSELKYTATHEWSRLRDDGLVEVGITDFAQNALGDIVFVELPEVEEEVAGEEEVAVVESVKAASDIYAPISGRVVEANDELVDEPERINADPYGSGWIFVIEPTDTEDLDNLLDALEYEEHCAEEEEQH